MPPCQVGGLFFCSCRGHSGPMVSDLDIYRTASVLIREHGDNAAFKASAKADEMLEAGNMAGVALWKASMMIWS